MIEIHAIPPMLRAAGWDAVLHTWGKMMSASTTDDGDDVPYWYGERALTGLLGGAAWKQRGGWALEEFTGERGKRLETKTGRGDLWLGLGKHEYTVEAKVKWPPSSPQFAVQCAKAGIRDASGQLRKLGSYYRLGTLIAVCYLVPCPRQGGKFDTRGNRQAIMAKLRRAFNSQRSLLASYFPKWPAPTEGGRIYPGVILVGKVIRWKAPTVRNGA